jgi:trimeric autotransporter adhesin
MSKSSRNGATRVLLLIAPVIILACFTVCPVPKAFGVTPAPDGGYAGDNTAEGDFALQSLTSGATNTAVGHAALYSNTTGSGNTVTGYQALFNNISGEGNTAVGFEALYNNTANDNTATGIYALTNNTIGSSNTATGAAALTNNKTGNGNTATGFDALLSNTASLNTADGAGALQGNTSGSDNTANGYAALGSNQTGADNTATGADALYSNKTGSFNTADGDAALVNNTSANNNTAVGFAALQRNTVGHDNTAEGFQAANNTTGNNNVALGSNAGGNLTTGSNNIDIGANVPGVAGEANTIRIGKQGTQRATFIAGISGTTVAGTTVVVNSTGKLGVASSSARFKEAVKPMDKASEAILALKPVSFRYKEEIDPEGIPQFGLIAEEVEKVDPDLVGRDENGKVNTVRYEAVNAMLLNEFLKEHRTVQELKGTVAQQEAVISQQARDYQATVAQQQSQIEALTTTLQKISEEVEISRSTAQRRVRAKHTGQPLYPDNPARTVLPVTP